MITQEQKLFFHQQGYLIKNILSDGELSVFLDAANKLMLRPEYAEKKLHQVFFLQPSANISELHNAVANSKILNIIEQLIGPNLIIDNASSFLANAGVSYAQGWHRDVLQVPEELIDDAWFSPNVFHNNVQVNLALLYDHCFWCVPGSHIRPNTLEETKAFIYSKHMSPVNSKMPGGIQIKLEPGQAVFVNNNIIHRGFGGTLTTPRRTLHLGYHSKKYSPTYHFQVLKYKEFTNHYIKSLNPVVAKMVKAHVMERERNDHVRSAMETHTNHQDFIHKYF